MALPHVVMADCQFAIAPGGSPAPDSEGLEELSAVADDGDSAASDTYVR